MEQFEHLARKTEFNDFVNMVRGNSISETLSSVDPVFGALKESHEVSKTSRRLQLEHTLNSFK